jgi:galactokinase
MVPGGAERGAGGTQRGADGTQRGPGGPGAAGRITAGQVAEAFRSCYQASPEGVWRAPGRVNLIGEHTDYNDGLVLPFALDRDLLVAGSRRADGVLDMRSRQAVGGAVALDLAAIGPGRVSGWAAYPAGVAWALRAAGIAVGGANLVIDSDLPQGAGLSSSAALACATALALTGLYGVAVPGTDLAALARKAEQEVAGVPCGIMDFCTSLLGQRGHALLLDCATGARQAVRLPLDQAGLRLLVIDTGTRHALADGRYAQRRRECERAAHALGVRSLRAVTSERDLAGLAGTLHARARHVVRENDRVRAAVRSLRAGALAALGPLLTASHASLRDDFAVSWPQADIAVAASTGAGALGARMMGGGFGGSVLALVPAADAGLLRAAVAAAFADHGWAAPSFLEAWPGAGASRLM